jgi:hypothetical protein
MTHDPKIRRKPYSAPSFEILDADAAKAELKAKGEAKDVKMLSLIEGKRKKVKAKRHS